MIEDVTVDDFDFEPSEIVASQHYSEFHVSDPDWDDIPTLDEAVRDDVTEIVVDVVPGILANGAGRRYSVITTLGQQYVRYRRAGCLPAESRKQAIDRTSAIHNLGESGVYEHIRALDVEGATEMTEYLETVAEQYFAALPARAQAYIEPCRKLISALSPIAEISETPRLDPSDISLQDVYKDQPGERDRVLTADHDVLGLPGPNGTDRGASVPEAERILASQGLTEMPSNEPVYLTDDATVYTRDISTYETAYSQVLRTIFTAIQSEMVLRGKQKPGPTISESGDDNAAVRAELPYPESINADDRSFARVEVQYWRRGGSSVRVYTHPCGRVYDEKDPTLSGPIEKISKPGIHALIGKTIEVAEQMND